MPDSVVTLDECAFSDNGGSNKNLAIHLSPLMALRLLKGRKHDWDNPLHGFRFEIDGDYFKNLKEYEEYRAKNKAVEKHWAEREKVSGTAKAAETPIPVKPVSPPAPATATEKPSLPDPYVYRLKLPGETRITSSMKLPRMVVQPIEIPEGITEIGDSAFSAAQITAVKMPKSLKTIGDLAFEGCYRLVSVEIQEGLETIGRNAFAECPKLKTVRLPSTIRSISRNAFLDDLAGTTSKVIIHIPGKAARRLVDKKEFRGLSAVIAAGFVIDGNQYSTMEEYVEKIEAEEKAARDREIQEKQKAEQRNALLKQIRDLEAERDAAKGLFAGMKRNKLQKQIDELREKLEKI